MNVTILGATGSMGREIASQLIRSRALSRREILQLAANRSRPASRWCAEGIRRDLQDAYAEISPELQVVEDPEEFIGDIVVVAAGGTIPPGDFARGRQGLEAEARIICDAYAASVVDALTRNQITPTFLIVSNPVEYVVQAFADEMARRVPGGERFVLGMGAHSDSLRFQWEIAHDLGLVRDRVSAKVVGEHGPQMIPRWSTVQIRGMPEKEQERCLRRLVERDREAASEDFDTLLGRRLRETFGLLDEMHKLGVNLERSAQLMQTIEGYRPDFRMILKPHVIHHSNSKTAHATGAAAGSLLKAILHGEALVPVVQRMVSPPDEPAAPKFPFGVPGPLAELIRFSGSISDDPWEWRHREFAPGSFRAACAVGEVSRIRRGIDSMRQRSALWRQERQRI